MQIVGLKVLKNKLSEYIRAAAAGETVLVTDRDRVVAEIGPPRSALATSDATDAERQWAELIRQGLVRPAKKTLTGPPRNHPIIAFDELMAEIDADRDDR